MILGPPVMCFLIKSNMYIHYFYISLPVNVFRIIHEISSLQIRRMQDMLAQMQEKLKATGQIGPGIGLRGRVGSLGNDLDSTDVEKKRNSIIDV